MEPPSKCLRFYEYHTVVYTTLWDMMSTERRLSQERYQVFMQQSFTSERETGSLRMLPKASAPLLFGTREVDKHPTTPLTSSDVGGMNNLRRVPLQLWSIMPSRIGGALWSATKLYG
jgi:hypothetical protein